MDYHKQLAIDALEQLLKDLQNDKIREFSMDYEAGFVAVAVKTVEHPQN